MHRNILHTIISSYKKGFYFLIPSNYEGFLIKTIFRHFHFGSKFLSKHLPDYLIKVSNRNSRKRREICSKLTIKKPEWRHWHHSGIMFNISPFSTACIVTLNKSMFAWLSQTLKGYVCFYPYETCSSFNESEKYGPDGPERH